MRCLVLEWRLGERREPLNIVGRTRKKRAPESSIRPAFGGGGGVSGDSDGLCFHLDASFDGVFSDAGLFADGMQSKVMHTKYLRSSSCGLATLSRHVLIRNSQLQSNCTRTRSSEPLDIRLHLHLHTHFHHIPTLHIQPQFTPIPPQSKPPERNNKQRAHPQA